MKEVFYVPLFSALALLSASCSYHNEAELYACDSSHVSYSLSIKPIIEKNCYACHSDASSIIYGNGINLEGHSNLKNLTNVGLVIGNIKHEPGFIAMPKGGPKLSTCEIAKIEAWVNKGAPND